TDGLDGLAIVPVMVAAAAFGTIAYLAGNAVFADYLQIHFTPGTGELSVVLGAAIGAGLGFLWFNAPPAAIFMGDTGSLALGGLIGSIAVATKHEIVRSEEHTSELQSRENLVCRLLLEKKKERPEH